eukprot:tig00021222_g19365.t1
MARASAAAVLVLLVIQLAAAQPVSWTCAGSRYRDSVCDCNCGAPDPDCGAVAAGSHPFCGAGAPADAGPTSAFVAGWGSDAGGALGDGSRPFATMQRALNLSRDVIILPGRLEGTGNCGLQVTGYGAPLVVRGHPGYTAASVDCGAARDRFLSVPNGPNVFLSGLTVLNGYRSSGSTTFGPGQSAAGSGGALSFGTSNATLSVASCRFLNNSAEAGGAIYVSASSDVTIRDSEFVGNTAGATGGSSTPQGGAVLLSSATAISIRNCSFSSNRAVGNSTGWAGVGGALAVTTGGGGGGGGRGFASSSTSVAIEGCAFESNVAEAAGSGTPAGLGGAVAWLGSAAPGSSAGGEGALSIARCRFVANTAVGYTVDSTGHGGAILVSAARTVAIVDSSFVSNVAVGGYSSSTGLGAAAVIDVVASLSVARCSFLSNSVQDKGTDAIHGPDGTLYVSAGSGGTLDALNFTRNSVPGDCSALAFYATLGPFLITRLSLEGNAAGGVGGFCAFSSGAAAARVTLEDAYFADNTAGVYAAAIYSASFPVVCRRCRVYRNYAASGGAISTQGTMPLDIVDSDMRDNVAKTSGGIAFISSGVLRFTNCTMRGSRSEQGGVVFLYFGTVSIDRSRLEDNFASAIGGAVYLINGEMAVSDSALTGNGARGSGGAIHLTNPLSKLAITRCRFERNSAGIFNGHGGALMFDSPSIEPPLISDTSFVGNSAIERGGAIYVGNTAVVRFERCLFSSNTAHAGGALTVDALGTARVSESSFESNRADEFGGALLVAGLSSLVISGGTIAGNRAQSGGGMAVIVSGSAEVTGTAIRANEATGSGGGLHAAEKATATFSSVVFESNVAAGDGGGALLAAGRRVALGGARFVRNSAAVRPVPPRPASAGNASFCDELRVDGAAFAGNAAGASGGALYVEAPGNCTGRACPGCAFEANAAPHGPDIASAPVRLGRAGGLGPRPPQGPMGTALLQLQGGAAAFSDLVLNAQTVWAFSGTGPDAFRATVPALLRPCRRGEVQLPGTSVCTLCPPGSYSLATATRDLTCLPCPEGSTCHGDSLASLRGYWQAPWNVTRFIPCVNDACLPNSTCAPGYGGNLCTVCQAGYGRANRFDCRQCPPGAQNAVLSLAAALLLVLLAALMVRSTMKNALDERSTASILIKIFLNYVQIMTFSQAFDLPWPNSLKDIFRIQEYSTAPLSSIISIDCMLRPSGSSVFFTRILLYAIIPPIAVALCGAFWTLRSSITLYWKRLRRALLRPFRILLRRRGGTGGTRRRTSSYPGSVDEGGPGAAPDPLAPEAAAPQAAAFPPLKKGDAADADEGGREGATSPSASPEERARARREALSGLWENFVTSDMNIECYTTEHLAWAVALGFPSVSAVCLGVPVAGLLVLVQNRGRLADPRFRAMFGFLYRTREALPVPLSRGYTRRFFFWEAIVIFRKLLVVFVSVYFSGRSMTQALLGLLVLLVVALSEALAMPFERAFLNYVDVAAVSTAAFTVYAGLFFYSTEVTDGDKQSLSICLVVLNCAFMAAFFAVFAWEALGAASRLLPRTAAGAAVRSWSIASYGGFGGGGPRGRFPPPAPLHRLVPGYDASGAGTTGGATGAPSAAAAPFGPSAAASGRDGPGFPAASPYPGPEAEPLAPRAGAAPWALPPLRAPGRPPVPDRAAPHAGPAGPALHVLAWAAASAAAGRLPVGHGRDPDGPPRTPPGDPDPGGERRPGGEEGGVAWARLAPRGEA